MSQTLYTAVGQASEVYHLALRKVQFILRKKKSITQFHAPPMQLYSYSRRGCVKRYMHYNSRTVTQSLRQV